MKISRSDLQNRYKLLDDNEIIHLYLVADLTREALSALKNEMDVRGITTDRDRLIQKQRGIKAAQDSQKEALSTLKKEMDVRGIPTDHEKLILTKREIEFGQGVKIDDAKLQNLIYQHEGNQNFPLAILGGAIAAGLAAAIWAAVSVGSGYQFGFMALLVGGMVAYAVRTLGKGMTKIFGVVGGLLSFSGCFVGNLLSSCVILSQFHEIPFLYVVLGLNLQLVVDIMAETFSYMDLIFYGLAIHIGYKYSFRKFTEQELASFLKG